MRSSVVLESVRICSQLFWFWKFFTHLFIIWASILHFYIPYLISPISSLLYRFSLLIFQQFLIWSSLYFSLAVYDLSYLSTNFLIWILCIFLFKFRLLLLSFELFLQFCFRMEFNFIVFKTSSRHMSKDFGIWITGISWL